MIWLLLLLSFPVQAEWIEYNGIGTWRADGEKDTLGPTIAWFNNYVAPGITWPAETWKVEFVEDYGIPYDVRQIDTSAILIITHGRTEELCGMQLVVKQFTGYYPPVRGLPYAGQVSEPFVGGGPRSGMSTKIPIVDGRFMWGWYANTEGTWPLHCSYGARMSVQEYVR